MDSDKFSAFVTIIPFEDLQNQFNLLPRSWNFYVKSQMETPGTRKCVIITPNKISIEHAINVIHLAIEISPTSCKDNKSKQILRNQYIRWRSWMSERDYFKLSDVQKQRSKFLNHPFIPSNTF